MQKGTEIFSLKDKVALITGATGYLGSKMALILAEAGAHVLVNSRSQERALAQVTELISLGYSAEIAVFDVANENEISEFFDAYYGKELHILINNAYAGGAGNIECSKSISYEKSYEVSVVAAHNMLINALPMLRNAASKVGDASVINITSMYAMVSPDQRIYKSAEGANPPFYGAAKAALLQWTKYAACEFGHEKIRINSISPGAFPSSVVQEQNSEFIGSLSEKIPVGRVGQSEEIKGPILFLAAQSSSYVNGTNLVVDGGWTSW